MTEASTKRRRLERVAAACDLCKRRKVKCDGAQPCAYCERKNRAAACTFTAAKERRHFSAGNTPNNSATHRDAAGSATPRFSRSRAQSEDNRHLPEICNSFQQRPVNHDHVAEVGSSLSPTVTRDDGGHQDDTVVPLEGRILRDAHGKVIFIGDCAPLSFLQTVRHLITSEVDSEGFTIQASRDSLIEIAQTDRVDRQKSLSVTQHEVQALIEEYVVVTSGLVDLFEHDELLKEMRMWAAGLTMHSDDTGTAVFFLVLSIGAQESSEDKSENWFRHARDILLKHMCNNMNVATVQGFTLVAIYMLRSFQPNGAYLYFSLAARTAYAIGIHRTEVNASFGKPIRITRDRVWKSLRVVDMLISNVLGRPPSTSDVDCTVKYSVAELNREASSNVLDASVQIFMIIERVVVEVYSRKRISLRIADYVSRQLKGWASNWLRTLTELTAQPNRGGASRSTVVGACSALCSYYYGIMLLTRPFLIYEIYEHLGASLRGGGTQSDHRDKRKYADAALDAAASFVESLQVVVHADIMPRRMPLIVPWLFTTALVLAVGILGRSGLVFEESCEVSIRCLDYFGKTDPHARQYSLIVQSLLKITTGNVKKRELSMHLQRKQASSELFGLLPSLPSTQPLEPQNHPSRVQHAHELAMPNGPAQDATSITTPFDWTIYDADFFAMPWSNENDQGLQDFLQPGTHNLDGASVADIPLFPIYDQQLGGGFT